ncbi:hypothetical protein [Bacteroides uniformis]|jgi:hypothetical protein|uniref:hypothetical protein n=1 Tax=Bacteroides uniformis TaxID=820 RepID=UPI001898B331|nr:hypothetical protein [Bacteroides uniformis]
MKVASKVKDGRINAVNILLDMNIREYLEVAGNIIKNNEFQRKRVKNSSTVYALLKKDLRSNCTMPPIVLAIKAEKMNHLLNPYDVDEEQIKSLFKPENLIILDGLQRTYTILDLVDELKKENNIEVLNNVLDNSIRIEVYLGINKIGILYRMLTLNTGQTPMSIRHQIEMLYSDYAENSIGEVRLLKETDSKSVKRIGEYQFRDVIEGFNSYLDRDELGISRNELLENIQNLEKLALENGTSDLFKDYILTYNDLIKKIDSFDIGWEVRKSELDINGVFGRSVLLIFTKSQVLSGFGAAIGKLKDSKVIDGFETVKHNVNNIKLSSDINCTLDSVMINLLTKLDNIKNRAKKIGVEQRMFFTYFFRELFNHNSDSYLDINAAIESGFNKYISLI